MGSSGGFPIDLVLFAMIAAFLVLRLRSILGKRTGFERPTQPQPVRAGAVTEPAAGPVIDGRAEPVARDTRALPDPASATGEAMARLRGVDPRFDAAHFLAGAETAFRMIVEAFAAGRRDTLRPLLSDEMYTAFEGAITKREAAGEVQQTTIKSIEQAVIEAVETRGTTGVITVRFVSDQTNMTLNSAGQPVVGTDAVTEITDLWTFERDLQSPDPTWRLVAARSA